MGRGDKEPWGGEVRSHGEGGEVRSHGEGR